MVFGFNADAQLRSRFKERTSISFGGHLGIPNGEFQDVYGEYLYGVGGTIVTKNRFPFVYTGLNYSYARMGKTTSEIQLLDGENQFGSAVWKGYSASISNKIHRIHAVARFEPFRGKVQPYVEGAVGGVIYNSRMTIQEDSRYAEPEKSNLETSIAGSIGWSAGLKVQVVNRIFIEGRIENLLGSKASYMKPESIYINGYGDADYDMLRSQTNSRVFQLGISFEL